MLANKKMLQIAWLTNSYDYEIRAYANLAKQNFYLQFPEKSKIYTEKAIGGLVETKQSRSRHIGIDNVLKVHGFKSKNLSDKYDRLGFAQSYKY